MQAWLAPKLRPHAELSEGVYLGVYGMCLASVVDTLKLGFKGVLAGPIGAVRVIKTSGGNWVVNPSLKLQKAAALSLLYAGTGSACTLLEMQV